MKMPLNSFKRALMTRQAQIGLFLGLANSYTAEIVAGTGFDWLLIDGEHGPNDVRSIIEQLQALAPYPTHPVVRMVDHDVARIKQLLDGGVQTLMVPMVESAAQAEQLVRAMRYPPQGIRGVGTAMSRAARWNGVQDYFAHADEEMCLIVQIESLNGLAQLSDILQVDGVDAVFIGPSDLAASMGYLGQPGHEKVKATVNAAVAQIGAAGKAAGVFASDPESAAAYQQMGASLLAVGVDALLLRNSAQALVGKFKHAASGSPEKMGAAY